MAYVVSTESNWNRIADNDLTAMVKAGWRLDDIAFALDRTAEAVEERRKELKLVGSDELTTRNLFWWFFRQTNKPPGEDSK